jgi:ribonuclease R
MSKSKRPRSAPAKLPSKEEILDFLANADRKTGKREIARAFGIKGADRIALKELLAEMGEEGVLGHRKTKLQQGQAKERRSTLPAVAIIEITGTDRDGDLLARPAAWRGPSETQPMIRVILTRRSPNAIFPPFGVGDRLLAKLARVTAAHHDLVSYEAEPIKRLPRERRQLLGIYRARAGSGGIIDPVDRRDLKEWPVRKGDEGEAKPGDLVRFDIAGNRHHGLPQARVIETLGNPKDERKISLIAVHAHGIPDVFPERVLAEAADLAPPSLNNRTDLRSLPLITIDPADARDHDDAVHAAPDHDPKNPGGFVITVAIADVAHYVRPNTWLDREAQLRGNSVYFPDRVVPMLPERISNDLCSLRPCEERACLAVRMVFDRHGEKRDHHFERAMMRSTAKLNYEEAQAAINGKPGRKLQPLMEVALRPLWAAYAVLQKARERREPLELELPERKIEFDEEGRIDRIIVPERLPAHRLIEEFMIQANVSAAETLEAKRAPVVYRVHDQPSKEKLTALREFLATVNLSLPGSGALRPSHFNRILRQAKSLPITELVNEVILRSQAQAEYAVENYGHFGLNLRRYAHFTSPIRRYADLLVHRSLIRALCDGALAAGALTDGQAAELAELSQSISVAERRAMVAERETADRLIATFLADRVGAEFDGRITGVTRVGLFVRLENSGADGFIPAATLGRNFWRHEEAAHVLVDERTGEAFRLGDGVRVRLVEAIPSAGALRFEMLSSGSLWTIAPTRVGRRRAKARRFVI